MSDTFDPGRREFLSKTLRYGLGAGAVALSSGHVPRPVSHRHVAGARGPESVRTEPGRPRDHLRFFSRPDLTPPGVSVRSAADFATSGLQSSYIFCAPKAPAAANPGPQPSHPAGFPPGAVPGLMILDTAGELVWFKPLPSLNEVPFNFRVQLYKGQPTLTWFEGTVAHGHGVGGRYVLADSSYRQIAQITSNEYPCDLHEFILTPEGTALHTGYQQSVGVGRGTTLTVGHALEVDVASNDLLFDWSCYPAISPDLAYLRYNSNDYFHINSIDLWPGNERNLLISSRNTSAVYLIDRKTKQVLWRLGGKRSNFALGRGVRFWYQHDARALPDGSGISVFDDASQPCPEPNASGKVISLDFQTRKAALRHRYLHTDGEMSTPSQGNVQLLDNSAHVVGWGYVPWFSVYAPSGHALGAPLILDGRFPDGADSYRTFLFDWVGKPPLDELALAVRESRHHRGRFAAFASWNGATEVASWVLRGGRSGSSMSTLRKAPKRGFETRIEVEVQGVSVFEVQALDSSGDLLGQSQLVSAQ